MNDSIMNGIRISMILGISAMLLVACGTDSEPDDEPDPAATGTALWNHLESENYQETWPIWPGTEELYEGTDPHGRLLTIYLNDIANDAVMNGITPLPEGAIVVKENYMPDSTLAAVTSMYKVDDFDPEHNDWFWLENDREGVISAEGRVEMCQSCHEAAANDYLFTDFPEDEVSENMIGPGGNDQNGILADLLKINTERMTMTGNPISNNETNLIREWINLDN